MAAEHEPASYEQLHLSMLAGLLGNIGCKLDEEDWYLGARGIKFYRHPGAHLNKKPGRWIVCAELVETTRLFGRGIANIEPLWIEQVAGPPAEEAAARPALGEEGRRGDGAGARHARTAWSSTAAAAFRFGRVDLHGAREIFIREALVAGQWDTRLPFLAANQKLVKQVEDLEHKSRRQDVLVDDELIYAFYDKLIPADVCSGATFERWYREASRAEPGAAETHARRADAPRGGRHHHAVLSENRSPGRRGLRGRLPARTRRPARRRSR